MMVMITFHISDCIHNNKASHNAYENDHKQCKLININMLDFFVNRCLFLEDNGCSRKNGKKAYPVSLILKAQECNNKDYEDLAGKNDVIRNLRIYVHSLSEGEASAYSFINEKGNRRYHYDDGPQIGNNVSEFTLSAAEKDHCY